MERLALMHTVLAQNCFALTNTDEALAMVRRMVRRMIHFW